MEVDSDDDSDSDSGAGSSGSSSNSDSYAGSSSGIGDDPTYAQCRASSDWEAWKLAARDELRGVIESGTIEPVDLAKLDPLRKPISSKWAMKVKRDSSGKESKNKARWVARGFTQREGIDFKEVFAPVTRYSTVRVFASFLADPDTVAAHTDVKLAYLNGDLREELYIRPPEDFEELLDLVQRMPDLSSSARARVDRLQAAVDLASQKGEPVVLQLCKPLYGLKQAGNEWNRKLDATLRELGLRNFPVDPCLYIGRQGKSWLAVAVYVDDLLWIANDQDYLDTVIDDFSDYFEVSNLGEPEHFLGMRIRRGDGYCSVDQTTYTKKILDQFGMGDCNALTTPLDPSINFTRDMEPKTAAERAEMSRIPYREAVGSLMYLANGTRPDISAAVGILARYMSNPGHQHWLGVKRIFRYLRGTLDYGLRYELDEENDQIVGYSDADWASALDDRKSTSGFVFLRGGAAISWQSKKQQTVSLSSSESELHALVAAMKEGIAWRNRMKVLGFAPDGPTTIFSDNRGAIELVKAPTSREATKHIAIKSFFARDTIDGQLISTKFVKSADNLADVLTKAISGTSMTTARDGLGLVPILDA